MIERRLKKRFWLMLPGLYIAPWWRAEGAALNLSSTGLLFACTDEPQDRPKGRVTVEVDWPALLDNRQMFVRFKGQVVWTRDRLIGVNVSWYEFLVRGNGNGKGLA